MLEVDMKQFYKWMRRHLDLIIERGWQENLAEFSPNEDAGPGSIAIVLYKLGNRENNRRYLHIADKLVQHELKRIELLLSKPGMRRFMMRAEVLLENNRMEPESLMDEFLQLIKTADLGIITESLREHNEEEIKEVVLGLPVLIAGMIWYTNDKQVRKRCKVIAKTLAMMGGVLVLRAPEFLEILLQKMGMKQSMMTVCSYISKFQTSIARYEGDLFFSRLGARVADSIQEREWHEDTNSYTDSSYHELAGMLEALGMAYRSLEVNAHFRDLLGLLRSAGLACENVKQQKIKDRTSATFKRLFYAQFHYPDKNGETMGVYYPSWLPGSSAAAPFLDSIQMFQAATAEWYYNLRPSLKMEDARWAKTHYQRFGYGLRFCRTFTVTEGDPIMAHDLLIDSNCQVASRNAWPHNTGSMTSNGSLVLNYLNMTGAPGGVRQRRIQ